jgi:hypothetical protein
MPMSKPYKGKATVARLVLDIKDPACTLYVKIAPHHVHMFTNIMEGFSHLSWVTTFHADNGILAVFTTPDTLEDVRKILTSPPCSEIVEIVGQKDLI